MDGKVAAEDKLKKLLSDPALMKALSDKLPKGDAAKNEDAE
jgi:hypothetical protein